MTTLVRQRASVLALLVCSGACSLRSLDYLENGDAGAGAVTAGTGNAARGGSGGSSNTGGSQPATGGQSGTGGSQGGSSGSSGGTETAGTTSAGGVGGGASGTAGTGIGGMGGTGGTGGAGSSVGGSDMGGAGSDDGGGAGEGGSSSCPPGEPGCPPLLVDEAPYLLRPGHALDKCADVQNLSAGNGAAVIQYECLHQLNQVFWLEVHEGGYVAFRNALSGKCLEVDGASLAEGAPVEQWSCTGGASQLFLPVPASDGLVKLVAQHSEKFLDVAGSASTNNVVAIVQSTDDGGLDLTWQLERSEPGAFVMLAAEDQNELLLRHDGDELSMAENAEGGVEWKVVRGLANRNCVSFASRDDQDRYLRQTSFALVREPNDGSNEFALDATFCIRPPLVGNGFVSHALESEAYPGHYLMRSDDGVVLEPFEDTAEFRTAATWSFEQRWP